MITGRDIKIRSATKKDAPSISALAIHVFLDTYATDGIRPDLAREVFNEYSSDIFLARMVLPEPAAIDLAEIDGHLVGFVEMDIAKSMLHPSVKEGLEILKLYVQPRFHGQGVGKALLDAAEIRARHHNLEEIWLTAWEGNSKALGFYSHFRFMNVGIVEHLIEGQPYTNRILLKRMS